MCYKRRIDFSVEMLKVIVKMSVLSLSIKTGETTLVLNVKVVGQPVGYLQTSPNLYN